MICSRARSRVRARGLRSSPLDAPSGAAEDIRALALERRGSRSPVGLDPVDTVDEATLMKVQGTKGAGPSAAISRRPVLVEALTDVLVERGISGSRRARAEIRCPIFGVRLFDLVKRSEDDSRAGAGACCSLTRDPRQHMLKLFAGCIGGRASQARSGRSSQTTLAARDGRAGCQSNQAQPGTFADFRAARGCVKFCTSRASYQRASSRRFAKEGKFDETIIGCRSCATCRSGWWSAQ